MEMNISVSVYAAIKYGASVFEIDGEKYYAPSAHRCIWKKQEEEFIELVCIDEGGNFFQLQLHKSFDDNEGAWKYSYRWLGWFGDFECLQKQCSEIFV